MAEQQKQIGRISLEAYEQLAEIARHQKRSIKNAIEVVIAEAHRKIQAQQEKAG